MSRDGEARWGPVAPAVLLGMLTLIALALRAWNLGGWGLEGDEVYTFRDSIQPPGFDNSRPLIYFLNYYLVRPWVRLDELGLRLLPAFFGVLAVPAIYWVTRRVLGIRAALFAALLLTFSALHIYHSQSARYWSLVFLLSAIYPALIYVGVREGRRGWLAGGVLVGVLATLAHPTAGFLFGGLVLWLLLELAREGRLRQIWSLRRVRWSAFPIVAVALLIAWRFLPVLRMWMNTPHMIRLRGPDLLLSYVDGLTVAVVVLGGLGIIWLWQSGERSLALLLACLFGGPAAVCLALSYVTAVSTAYLLATAPVFFIGAGAFLDRFAAQDRALWPHGLLTVAFTTLALAGDVPVLISQYRDGGRADFRGAAGFVETHRAPGDAVFADQHPVVQHYLRGVRVLPLPDDATILADALAGLRAAQPPSSLWAIVLASERGGFRGLNLSALSDWLYDNCQLRASLSAPRLDFRRNELQVYRCPALAHADLPRPDSNSR